MTIEMSTGVAQWTGPSPAHLGPLLWASPLPGHTWLGDADLFGKSPSRSTFSLSFSVLEEQTTCSAFTLAFAVDDYMVSAKLNGHDIEVPEKQGARKFAQLVAPRGMGLFVGGYAHSWKWSRNALGLSYHAVRSR